MGVGIFNPFNALLHIGLTVPNLLTLTIYFTWNYYTPRLLNINGLHYALLKKLCCIFSSQMDFKSLHTCFTRVSAISSRTRRLVNNIAMHCRVWIPMTNFAPISRTSLLTVNNVSGEEKRRLHRQSSLPLWHTAAWCFNLGHWQWWRH